MSDIEKNDAEGPGAELEETAKIELDDATLEQVAGGMGAAVPRVDHATSLDSLSTPVCLSQT